MANIANPTDQPTDPEQKLRWYQPSPGRFFFVLLAVEGILLLSEGWFPKGWAVLIAVAFVGVAFIFLSLWFILALLFRWRFQYSIRSLLAFTMVVAIPCSWLTSEMTEARKQKEAVAALRNLGGIVQHDDGFDPPEPTDQGMEVVQVYRRYPGNDLSFPIPDL